MRICYRSCTYSTQVRQEVHWPQAGNQYLASCDWKEVLLGVLTYWLITSPNSFLQPNMEKKRTAAGRRASGWYAWQMTQLSTSGETGLKCGCAAKLRQYIQGGALKKHYETIALQEIPISFVHNVVFLAMVDSTHWGIGRKTLHNCKKWHVVSLQKVEMAYSLANTGNVCWRRKRNSHN